MSAQTRPLTKREERRFEKKCAREYGHQVVHRFSPCWHMTRRPCALCSWRLLRGYFRKNRAAFGARRNNP